MLRTFLHYYLHFIKSSILFRQQHERLQALKWSCGTTCFQDETMTSHKHTALTKEKMAQHKFTCKVKTVSSKKTFL
jgi:hypothetical protein